MLYFADVETIAVDDFNSEAGLAALGKVWIESAKIDWPGFYRNEKRRRIALPPYPFERRRYWVEPRKRDMLEKKPDIADWLHVPSWNRSPAPDAEKAQLHDGCGDTCWLVFLDECGFGRALSEKLKRTGRRVVTARIGEAFTRTWENDYSLNPGQEEDFASLLQSLHGRNVERILHLWSVTNHDGSPLTARRIDAAQNVGFYSLLFLTRALARRRPASEITLVAVSNHVQEVIGGERLCPEKATLLGAVKVIPLEHPDILCRGVDIVLPEPSSRREGKLIDNLIAEAAIDSPDHVVAWRNDHRWVQALEPVWLEASDRWKERVKENGATAIRRDKSA